MINITQAHRIVLRKKANAEANWQTLTLEPDDLGADTQLTFNIAPMKRSRTSSAGTTESAIPGTFDNLTASINVMLDNWKIIGEVLDNWNKATYAGADPSAGQIIFGAENMCGSAGQYWSVIVQGICEDGSETEVEFARCQPALEDDIEVGSNETGTVTIALNPIIYNAAKYGSDGYPQYTARLGGYSTDQNMRLNPTSGEYVVVGEE